MDMLGEKPVLDLRDDSWRIYSRTAGMPPQYVKKGAHITDSCITEGCYIAGDVFHSVVFTGVNIEDGVTVGKLNNTAVCTSVQGSNRAKRRQRRTRRGGGKRIYRLSGGQYKPGAQPLVR